MVAKYFPSGITGRNRRLLATLHRNVAGPFSVKEAAETLLLSIPRTHKLLSYLAERGWLVRLQRGLYTVVPLEATEPGKWVEDPWVVAAGLYGPSSYIGGWSASEHWHLTEQLFRETVVITSRRVRNTATVIQGFTFCLKRVKEDKLFGIRTVWRGRTKVGVSDPSRTLADLLSDPSLGGGIRHIADVLETYFLGEHLDEPLLLDYVERLGNRTAFKRLGYLVETLELDAPRVLRHCRDSMSLGVSLLDPSLPDKGPSLRKWNLRVNALVSSGSHSE